MLVFLWHTTNVLFVKKKSGQVNTDNTYCDKETIPSELFSSNSETQKRFFEKRTVTKSIQRTNQIKLLR